MFLSKINVLEKNSKKDKWRDLIEQESIDNCNIPILKEVKKNVEDNGASLLLVDNPQFPTSNLSQYEKQICLTDWSKGRIAILQNNPEFLGNGYFRKTNQNYTSHIFSGPPNKLMKSYWVNDDFENDFVSVKYGYRQGLKKEYTINCRTIYLFGSSVAYSFGCEESHTLSSFIEARINSPEIKVVNRGVRGGDLLNSALAILDTKIRYGDLIILYAFKPITKEDKTKVINEIEYLDLTHVFARPHNYGDVFFDSGSHSTPAGNKVVAKLVANKIQDMLCHKSSKTMISYSDVEKSISKRIRLSRYRAALNFIDISFPAYIEFLKSKYLSGNNGMAAMNCNPFTLGHKHLVTKASKMVDNLYVFVLEEEKSTFSFKQRFEMVKEGVKEIGNVIVVPTGKFVVSSMTFPDYFSKENGFNPSMNVAYDFEIFVNYIAPVLGIQSRFIGTEPFCKTTSFQHEIMKEFLPQNGISVVEIERVENEYGPISAKCVREILENNDFERLDLFLPATTITLLMKFGIYLDSHIA